MAYVAWERLEFQTPHDKEAIVTEPGAVVTGSRAQLHFGGLISTKPNLKLSFGPGRYRSRFCNDALLELGARPSTGGGNVNRVRHMT
jgi:hypothetical protein